MKSSLERLNECARMLYSDMGCVVKKGYDFQNARHPQEQACFAMAVRTCNYWRKAFKEDGAKKKDETERATDNCMGKS